MQPILKADLSDFLGILPEAKLMELQARLLDYMGLADEEESEEADT